MSERRPSRRRITLAADKAYDVRQFVKDLRKHKVTPHIAIDGRMKRHAGYEASQRCRKRIEEVFDYFKSSAGMAKIKLRGCDRVGAASP